MRNITLFLITKKYDCKQTKYTFSIKFDLKKTKKVNLDGQPFFINEDIISLSSLIFFRFAPFPGRLL